MLVVALSALSTALAKPCKTKPPKHDKPSKPCAATPASAPSTLPDHAQAAVGAASSGAPSSSGSSSSGSSSGSSSAALSDPITGKATFYGGNLSGGTCSFTTLSTIPNGMTGTAYSGQVWNNGAMCGACVQVTGPKGNSIKAMVRTHPNIPQPPLKTPD